MKSGTVYVVQCQWKHAYVAEVERFDPTTGMIQCKRVCTVRQWRNKSGLEGVAAGDPWHPTVTLEMQGAAGDGLLNWFHAICLIRVAHQGAWKARLAGEVRQ